MLSGKQWRLAELSRPLPKESASGRELFRSGLTAHTRFLRKWLFLSKMRPAFRGTICGPTSTRVNDWLIAWLARASPGWIALPGRPTSARSHGQPDHVAPRIIAALRSCLTPRAWIRPVAGFAWQRPRRRGQRQRRPVPAQPVPAGAVSNAGFRNSRGIPRHRPTSDGAKPWQQQHQAGPREGLS